MQRLAQGTYQHGFNETHKIFRNHKNHNYDYIPVFIVPVTFIINGYEYKIRYEVELNKKEKPICHYQ